MSKTTVQKTIMISLIVQFISTIVTWEGFYEKSKKIDLVLQEILLAENIVQVIEFSFYVWISYASHKPVDITPRTYRLGYNNTNNAVVYNGIYEIQYF